MSKENPREVVLDMLLIWDKEKEYVNKLLNDVLYKYDYLEKSERAFISRLFTGCVERRIELDYVINQYANTKVNKMKPLIRNAIRMGTYQLLYMDKVPDNAACDETVKLIRKRGFDGLKGFANGVLRNIARNKGCITYPEDMVMRLSVMYSMPEWIVERFIKDYGKEVTKTILNAYMEELPVTFRVDENIAQEEKEAFLEAISKTGATVKGHEYLPYAYSIKNADGVAGLPGFSEGKIMISDVSSMLAVHIAGIGKNNTVLDVCAAPGGKTMHAATLLQNTGKLLSRDISEYKVSLIEENIARTGYKNIETAVWDATCPDESLFGKMDVVIADVPCSGLGVIGKKQDIKYNASVEGINELADIQRKILDTVAKYVKAGGVLIYSTCTMTVEENHENRKWFLENYPFEAVSIEEKLPEPLRELTGDEGYLQLLPGIHKTDGFFIAKFRRKE